VGCPQQRKNSYLDRGNQSVCPQHAMLASLRLGQVRLVVCVHFAFLFRELSVLSIRNFDMAQAEQQIPF
jgi:hypothetical protein